ncbi:MAG: acetate--CoA ligase family protein [Rhodocyclaceae bacterium]|nr:acetate--CoA ligase family protein [Rhodocyclaceae bacterium]
MPGLYERLSAWLPSLIEHRCSVGERGGFCSACTKEPGLHTFLSMSPLELQNLAGQRTGFGKARQTSKTRHLQSGCPLAPEQVTRECLFAARDLLMAAINDTSFAVPGTVERLRALADRICLGPSTTSIVDAATERGIPSIRLNEGNLVQLGYGIRQRRIWTAESDSTSAIAESISRDKDLTKSLLSACGLPVPEGRIVSSPEDAWEAAEEIGLPVAVKPTDANHARGVSWS